MYGSKSWVLNNKVKLRQNLTEMSCKRNDKSKDRARIKIMGGWSEGDAKKL